MDTHSTPLPGSPEAQIIGCRCPVLDNQYGEGFVYAGRVSFWMSADCPLHGSLRNDGGDRCREGTCQCSNGHKANGD